jgi:hypothetical protein
MSQMGSAVGTWRKSNRCESQQCVEIAQVNGQMAIRNSTDPERYIVFGTAAWRGFMITLRSGEWDN